MFLTLVRTSPTCSARVTQLTHCQLIWDAFTDSREVQKRGECGDYGEGHRYTSSQSGPKKVPWDLVTEKTLWEV